MHAVEGELVARDMARRYAWRSPTTAPREHSDFLLEMFELTETTCINDGPVNLHRLMAVYQAISRVT